MTQRTWITVLLILSLGLNIFILGYFIGGQADRWFKPKPGPEIPLKGIIQELPSQSQKELMPQLKNQKQKSRENRRKIHQLRSELMVELANPELNKQKVRQLLDEIQSLSSENMKIAQDLMYVAISSASFEDRLRMIETLKKKHKRHRRHR